jgi:hypothetical protein
MVKTKEEKIMVSPYSKFKIHWEDRTENYSKEAKNKIKAHFAKKYGVSKNAINVLYIPVKIDEFGNTVEITGANIDNIMDFNYQRQLMQEWIKREGKVVDFERIIKLDDKVNGELNMDKTELEFNSWSIKWLMVDNFLSFGADNYLPFNKLRGLTVVNSIPANQGGKTTLTIDALKFLLHGTTTKTDKNEDVFNTFSGLNELNVKGMIEIGNEEVIIERHMTRSKKKAGGWNVTNKVSYYRLLPDGTEELLTDEHAIKTTARLKATIGTEEDFEMLVLATEKNLDDLIGLTTTESGKVLTRLIGLEVIEKKEEIARKMYNTFNEKKKSNSYNVVTLTDDIEDHEAKIQMASDLKVSHQTNFETTKTTIQTLNDENDTLLNSKMTIDVTIQALNPSKLETEIENITTEGKGLAAKKADFETKIAEIGQIAFDEDKHFDLTKKKNKNVSDVMVKKSEITRLTRTIGDLVAGGICSSCNRKLDDVDNSEHIKKHEETIAQYKKDLAQLEEDGLALDAQLVTLSETKKRVDEKNRLDLDKDRAEVEIGALRNKITAKKNDLKKYKLNQDGIEFNRSVDAKVAIVKTNLEVANRARDEYAVKIERVANEITGHRDSIAMKLKIIDQIKKEEEIEKIYKTYIELVGKKGISKLVLRSVLPIINSEVQRLLDDVCDFDIEIFINDKNDVQFLLVKDGVSKTLKSGSGFEKTASSLALRGVLGKISTLPMPNFITFDEVLGKIANENLEKLKPLFEKIKSMYEIVFLITHNDVVKDWSDNVLTVVKDNNISKVTLK